MKLEIDYKITNFIDKYETLSKELIKSSGLHAPIVVKTHSII